MYSSFILRLHTLHGPSRLSSPMYSFHTLYLTAFPICFLGLLFVRALSSTFSSSDARSCTFASMVTAGFRCTAAKIEGKSVRRTDDDRAAVFENAARSPSKHTRFLALVMAV